MDLISVFTVSFFGHRQISDYCIFEKLEALIKSLLNENEYVVFLVGYIAKMGISVRKYYVLV